MMFVLGLGGDVVVAEDRHRLRPGHHRLVDVLALDVALSVGAYLPRVSAPPEPAKLWHIAQLTRNSSPPSATSPPSRLCSSASGIGGAGGQRGDVGGERRDLLLGEPDLLLTRGAWTPGPASGIRPVPDLEVHRRRRRRRRGSGRPWCPGPCRPWQVAQLARNSFSPSSTGGRGRWPAPGRLRREQRVGDPDEDQPEQQEDRDRGGVAAAGGQGVQRCGPHVGGWAELAVDEVMASVTSAGRSSRTGRSRRRRRSASSRRSRRRRWPGYACSGGW